MLFTSSSIISPGGDWSLPDASTLQFDGDTGNYGYLLTACLQLGELFSPLSVGQRVLIALYNVTATPSQLGSASGSAVFYNHSNPEFLTSICTSYPLSSVEESNQFGIYAAIEYTDGSSGNAPLATSTFTLQAIPIACRGIEINFNISANFNNSQLTAQCGIELNSLSAEELGVRNTGLKSIRTNGDTPIEDCGDARLLDTETIEWSTSGENITADVLLEFIASGRCFSVAQTGATVNYTSTAICSGTSNSSYILLSVSDSGVLSVDYVGVERLRALSDGAYLVGDVTFEDSPDGAIFWTRSGQSFIPHLDYNIVDNVTACASCDANGTLQVQKLCSAEPQCEVSADPPVSDPAPMVWFPCFVCGDGDDGGGGGDGGGGAPPVLPPVPPFIPFFPPILPPIIGAPGSGSGTPGVAAVPIPIITNCSASTNTTGGTYISQANFTSHVPCCNEDTLSLDVLEIGSIPNYHYICEMTGNGSTYAWVPQAAASAATYNVTTYNQQTTMSFTNSSTIIGDSTSQFIWNGVAYIEDLYVNNVILNATGSIDGVVNVDDYILACNAISGFYAIGGCSGNPLLIVSDISASGALQVSEDILATGPIESLSTLTGSGLEACGGDPVKFNQFGHCDGVSLVEATTGITVPAGEAILIQANAGFEINSAGTMRRTPVLAVASSISVTANGQLVYITVNAGVCDTSITNPCVITITNNAITIATTVARMGIVAVGYTGSAYQIYTTAITNLLTPSMDVLFFCPTACGPNFAFSFYVELVN